MRLVTSDLDGVLVDSSEVYTRAIEDSLERRGIEWEHEKVVGCRIAHVPTWIDALLAADLAHRDEVARELIAEVRARMAEKAGEIPIHPDARAVLSTIAAKYPLFLLTNSTSGFARGILDRHGLTPLFARVVTSDDGFSDKREAIVHLAEGNGCNVRDTAYVGDTVRDVASAHEAGCLAIVVYSQWSWDRSNLAALEAAGPDLIVRALDEVPGALERIWS